LEGIHVGRAYRRRRSEPTRTVKRLGIAVPTALLALADEVIE
jgi:hypothetical protein